MLKGPEFTIAASDGQRDYTVRGVIEAVWNSIRDQIREFDVDVTCAAGNYADGCIRVGFIDEAAAERLDMRIRSFILRYLPSDMSATMQPGNN